MQCGVRRTTSARPEAGDARHHGAVKTTVLRTLGWYRAYRSIRPDACRFSPSCSTYTAEAVEIHGVIRGLYLGTRRVLRCHPFGGQGYDPVPEAGNSKHLTSRKQCHA